MIFSFFLIWEMEVCVWVPVHFVKIKKQKLRSKKLNSYYLGFGYSNKEILSEITKFKLEKIFCKKSNKYNCKKITPRKIIAVFQGKSEFGPRSLGNRSILVKTVNKNINKSLNFKTWKNRIYAFCSDNN